MSTTRFLLATTLSGGLMLAAGGALARPARPSGGSGGGAAPRTTAAEAATIARGPYIVNDVALCWRCHTPLDAAGSPDRTRWLMGAPVRIRPSVPTDAWALIAPRLAGSPPGTDAQFVILLMTGISRTGAPPMPPMPQFHMTRADAKAVLAYLKSLEPAP
jgi:mono/diheme cytochrome c family protein